MGATANPAAERRRTAVGTGPILLLVLLVATVGAFAATRALRVQDDIVNSVELSQRVAPSEPAEIVFTTTVSDGHVDVLITDLDDRPVRALALDIMLAAGEHRFSWDGIGDDGDPVAEGEYGIRVILGDQGRDIKPPGRIEAAVSGGDAG